VSVHDPGNSRGQGGSTSANAANDPRSPDRDLHDLRTAVNALTPDEWRACLAGGGPIAELEAAVAAHAGARHALAVSSGTVALELGLRACGVGFGDEVILSAYDWGASAGAILRLGAIPVFGDIDPDTYSLDPAGVTARVTSATRAVIVTHLFGNPADMASLGAAARRAGLSLIEDASQALGATYEGRPVGSLGTVGCASLGWGKVVSGGEGGVLMTNDPAVFESAVFHSQHPLGQLSRTGHVGPLGELSGNCRIHPIAALLALRHLATLKQRVAERRAIGERLSAGLMDIPGVRAPMITTDAGHAYHRYSPTFVPDGLPGLTRDEYVAALVAEEVPVTTGFIARPLHLHDVFRRRSYGRDGWPWRHTGSRRQYRRGDCPMAEARCFERGLGVENRWDSPNGPAWVDTLLPAWRRIAFALTSRPASRRRGQNLFLVARSASQHAPHDETGNPGRRLRPRPAGRVAAGDLGGRRSRSDAGPGSNQGPGPARGAETRHHDKPPPARPEESPERARAAARKDRTVFRFTTKEQARAAQKRGLPLETHMTARGGAGRPLRPDTARSRYGIPETPDARLTVHLKKGQPVRSSRIAGAKDQRFKEITSPERVPRSSIVDVTPLKPNGR